MSVSLAKTADTPRQPTEWELDLRRTAPSGYFPGQRMLDTNNLNGLATWFRRYN